LHLRKCAIFLERKKKEKKERENEQRGFANNSSIYTPGKPIRLRHNASAVQIVVEKYEIVPGIYMVNFNRLSGNRDAYYELYYDMKKNSSIKKLALSQSGKNLASAAGGE
jgi:hypothetical protein